MYTVTVSTTVHIVARQAFTQQADAHAFANEAHKTNSLVIIKAPNGVSTHLRTKLRKS